MTTPIPLGRLLLVERLAVGGTAEVWAAVPRGDPDRPCAVKRMLPTAAEDGEVARRFLDEARHAARIEHPGILPIHEVGSASGLPHLVMPYVPGRSLRALLDRLRARGEALPASLSIHVAAAIADALECVHCSPGGGAPGLVHGDVSPANVLLGLDGRVRLCDLGLAHPEGRRSPGGPVPRGKRPYASPERLAGLAVDRRSDVFALGALLRELSGDRLPEAIPLAAAFGAAWAPPRTGPAGGASPARTAGALEAVRGAPRAAPPEGDARVRAALGPIVLRALARDPADRFGGAGELRDALVAAAGGAGAGASDLAALLADAFPEAEREERERRSRLRRAALEG